MKILCKHSSQGPILEEKLKHLSHIDFSLFCDIFDQSKASSLNIMVLQEPNEYFGVHDWTIKNKDLFSLILTWNDKVLNECPKAIYNAFGGTWLLPEQYNQPRVKKFETAHLAGKLQLSYGHSLRHELLARQGEIYSPKKFFHTYGERDDISKARIGKEEVFAESQYNIAIENFSHRGYFTEKLLDCFLFKSVPIYWGCSNLGQFFNINGVEQVQNVDDIINYCNMIFDTNKLFPDSTMRIAIEENYQTALRYIDFEQRVVDTIEKVFKNNNII